MSWKDRLQSEVVLVSPEGIEFTAAWTGDDRTMEKRLGIFDYPEIIGSDVQDMDVSAQRLPLTLHFEGDDHDLVGEQFFKACSQRGVWAINHPVHGVLSLQLVSVTQRVRPVESANITTMETQWVEPTIPSGARSVRSVGAEIRESAAVVNEQAANEMATAVSLEKPSALSKFIASVESLSGQIAELLSPITALEAEISAAVLSVYRGIVTTINSSALTVIGVAGQLQALVQLPAEIETDLSVRLDYYEQMIDQVTTYPPPKDNNDRATRTLVNTAALTAMCTCTIDAQLTTREEALDALDRIRATLLVILAAADDGQQLTEDSPITGRFFAHVESYNDIGRMVDLVSKLLIEKISDLSVAKYITLSVNRAPVEIALTEGIDLDFFISTNRLKGNEVLLIPAGRKVVVYL